MTAKWLICISLPPGESSPNPDTVTQLHGPFPSKKDVAIRAGEIASELNYPGDLVFAAFEIVNGTPVLFHGLDSDEERSPK